jgi:hypothetical protein
VEPSPFGGTTAFATKSSYHPDLKFPQNTPQKNTQKKKKPNNNDNTPKHKTKGDDLVNGGRYFPSLRSSLA